MTCRGGVVHEICRHSRCDPARRIVLNEAVVVSTARTGIGKAYRGALNATKSPTLVAHVLDHAIRRASIDAGEIEDFVLGTVLGGGHGRHEPRAQHVRFYRSRNECSARDRPRRLATKRLRAGF